MGEGNMQAKLLEAMYSRAIDQWLVVYGEDFGLVGKDNVSRLPSWQQMSLVPQQNNTFVMQYNDQSSQT
jgi:nicotinic acid mononucleotide adenylyltransferase